MNLNTGERNGSYLPNWNDQVSSPAREVSRLDNSHIRWRRSDRPACSLAGDLFVRIQQTEFSRQNGSRHWGIHNDLTLFNPAPVT
jgi:hypothetical protein